MRTITGNNPSTCGALGRKIRSSAAPGFKKPDRLVKYGLSVILKSQMRTGSTQNFENVVEWRFLKIFPVKFGFVLMVDLGIAAPSCNYFVFMNTLRSSNFFFS